MISLSSVGVKSQSIRSQLSLEPFGTLFLDAVGGAAVRSRGSEIVIVLTVHEDKGK